jgi:PhnB protein
VGNNTSIHLIVDAREEADRLFALLGAGSTECSPMADMSWGQYWGTALDRFGIRWMISVEA